MHNCQRRIIAVTVFVGLSIFVLGIALGTPVGATDSTELDDGEDFVYLGQDVYVPVEGNLDVSEGDQLYVYELDDGEIESTVDRPTVDDDGTILLETDDIETGDGPQFALTEESGLDGTEMELTIDEQEFEVDWDRGTVTSGAETVALDVDSNRGVYNVTISADELDYEELRAMFVHDETDVEEVTDPAHLPLDQLGYDRDDGDDVSDLRGDDYITLDLSNSDSFISDDEIVANIMTLEAQAGLPDEGEYEFNHTVTDTNAYDTSTIEISETDATFDETMYTRPAGDLVEVTVELEAVDEAWLQFGDEDVGFADVLYVEDDSGNDEVTFTVNTRLAGTDHSQLDGVGPDDSDIVYHSEDDIVESYVHDEVIGTGETAVSDANFYAGSDVEDAQSLSFEEYLEALGTLDTGEDPTAQLERPLQPGSYELVVDRSHNFLVDDGSSDVDEELAFAEIGLSEPGIEDVTTWAAPDATANEDTTLADLRDQFSARETVAIGDRAAVQFEATGVTGVLAAIDYVENDNEITSGPEDGLSPAVLAELIDDETDWVGEGIDFRFAGSETPNRDANDLALSDALDTEAYVLVDPSNWADEPGELAVVVDTTEAFDRTPADGESFDVELAYEGSDDRYRFAETGGVLGGEDGDTTTAAYPYYVSDYTQSETATITVEEPAVRFDTDDDGDVQMPIDGDELVGETNLAPGTEATVRVRDRSSSDDEPDESPSFLEVQSVTVEDDGSISVPIDSDDRHEGSPALVEFHLDGEPIDEFDAVFSDPPETQPPYFETTIDAPADVEPGDSFDVTATVRNTGEENGTANVRSIINDEVRTDAEMELGPDDDETVTETVDGIDEEGEQFVTISTQDDAAFAMVDVGNETESNATETDTETADEASIDAAETETGTDNETGSVTDSTDETAVDDDSSDGSATDSEPLDDDEGESDGSSGFGILVGVLAVVCATGYRAVTVRRH
ncbi:BGTF surface domain-containing protein [Natrialbaceae archaeon A-arb3/5]